MLKKTYFRNLCHVLQRTLVVSVVCFFTMVSYAWAYNVNFVCGSGATAISGVSNPVSVASLLNLQLSDATQYCQPNASGLYPYSIKCRDGSQNVICSILRGYDNDVIDCLDPIGVGAVTCTVDFAPEVYIRYDCGIGTAIGNQAWTQIPSATEYVSDGFWGFSATLPNSVVGYCVAPSNMTFVGWNCHEKLGNTFLQYQPGAGWFFRLNSNFPYNDYSATAEICTALWAPPNGSVIVLNNLDCVSYTQNAPTTQIYGWLQNGVFLNYDYQNGYTNQMSPSPLGANPVIVSDSAAFLGYFNSSGSNPYLTGVDQMINSYGEITQDGVNDGSHVPGLNVWYADCVKVGADGIIKLNSTDASLGGHGSEFVHQYNQNVYLYYNVNNTPQHTSQMTGNTNNITIPSRQGYIFAGYFSTQNGGTRYIDENGYLTPAGQAAVGGYNDYTVYEWYAHWCPIGSNINPDDGTCGACAEGESLNILDDLKLFNPEGTLSGFGFDADGTAFGDGHHDYLNGTPNTFGVWNVDQGGILLGSAMCSTDDESLSPASSLNVDSQNPEDNKYCWCSLTGGVQNGAQYSLSPSTWVYLTGDLGSVCEKYCAEYCAGLGYSGDYRDFIRQLLNQEYCTPQQYKVSYYCEKQKWLDGKEPLSVDTVFYGSSGYSFYGGENMTLAKPCAPAGYQVDGFECFTATNEDPVDDSVANPWTINDNVVCFASYAPNDYTITLNKVNGSGGANNVYTRYNTNVYRDSGRTQIMNTSINPINTPSRTGYNFMGYYSSSSGNNQNPYINENGYITQAGVNAGKALTSDGTWWAHWTPKTYTISYGSGNHGSVPNNGADPVAYANGLTYGSTWTTKTFAETGIVADTGYVFSGWNTSADGSGTSYTANTQQSAWTTDSGLTLYAVYNCAPGYSWNNDNTACVQDGFSVTYSCGSHGSGSPTDSNSPYVSGATVTTLAASVCTADTGYIFTHWSCDNSIGNKNAGTTFTMPSANVSCTAQWDSNVIALTWNTNGGTPSTVTTPSSCIIGSLEGEPGSISGIAQPTKTGYRFLGWDIMWNFANINVNLSGANRYARSAYSCWYNGNSASCSNTVYNDISAEMWKIEMSAGTVYGASQCQGFNCYCKATGFSPSGNNRIYQPSAELEWKYVGQMMINGTNACAYMCAQSCSNVSEQTLETILRQETIFGQ